MKKYISTKYIWYIAGIVFFICLWCFASSMIGQRTMILPGPFETLKGAVYYLFKPYTLKCIVTSVYKLIVAYFMALLFSMILGTVAGNSESFYYFLSPFMVFLRSVPTASLIYLFIVLMGFKRAPMALVFLISFPILYENIYVSIKNVSKEYIEAGRIGGNNRFEENINIRIPLASRYFMKSVISTFSLAFKTEIMAEVLTGSTNMGIGNLIQSSRAMDPTNMLPVFSYSLIAVGLMLIVELLASILIRRMSYERI